VHQVAHLGQPLTSPPPTPHSHSHSITFARPLRLFDGTSWNAAAAAAAAAAASESVAPDDAQLLSPLKGRGGEGGYLPGASASRHADLPTGEQLRVQEHRAIEELILAQSSEALAEIEAEYRAGEAALLLGDPASHVERFMTALARLSEALERIPRPVPPFSKACVLYKVLADGWLDILMSTLQAPVTDPLFVEPLSLCSLTAGEGGG
jgi:multidrug efflux pump subunit AcrA (membrane-fusion protein)